MPSRTLLLPVLGTFVFLFGLIGAPAQATPSRVPTELTRTAAAAGSAAFEGRVMVEINAARAHAGLAPIRFVDSCAGRLATALSKRIAGTGVMAHRDQGKVLRQCHQSWAGENLIRGVGLTPKNIVDAWLASPAHRAVLLKSRATRAGLAFVSDGQGRRVGVLTAVDRH